MSPVNSPNPFTAQAGISLPAMRGRQGGRAMYLVLVSNEVLNNLISPEMEPSIDRSQRAFDPRHAADIANYIVANPSEYVLGALTYAVDQAGTFTPAAPDADIGMLHLPLSARLRSVDGQHRRRGLKDAIDQQNWVGGDHTGILIYVESEVEKRKQMFSDMNWTARQVTKSVNVGFNSRDPFAKVVNIIVESHPLLAGRIETEKALITKGTNHLFTLGAIYEALRRLELGPDGRMGPKTTVDEVEVLAKGREFFDLLLDARAEFQRVLDDPDTTEDERKSTILLNGTVVKVIAGAVSLALKNGYGIEELTEPLKAVDFSPDARIWLDAGFIAPGKTTPGSRNQEVRAAVMALVEAIAPKKKKEEEAVAA
jgi:DGQHR domain-containing protein